MRLSVSIANAERNALVSRSYGLLLLVAALVIAVDQLTKQLALEALADGPIHLIDGAVSLSLHYNPGGAFGILQGMPWFFLVATLIVSALILVWARSLPGTAHIVPLGLVLGGGLGNATDRVVRDTGGRVVDFIDLHVWPVFNVADSAIVVGVGLLLFVSARSDTRS
ncbi:MAG TPA: signal peptidase II [Actinomycetota bacterium]|nr:signal peptidase II [Actinomycetota bacterium]